MKPALKYSLIFGLALLLVGGGFAIFKYTTTAAEPAAPATDGKSAVATFAGGCFWCMEPPFDKLDGVTATISGYTGGTKVDPSYEEVSSGTTGHTEAIQIHYDPKKVSYEKLVEVFWKNIDPTQADGQFCDHGEQYRSGIFYHNEEQKKVADATKKKVAEKLEKALHTEVTEFKKFYPAEDYHQDYYIKNPIRYKFYRYSCGRDAQLERLWGKPAEEKPKE